MSNLSDSHNLNCSSSYYPLFSEFYDCRNGCKFYKQLIIVMSFILYFKKAQTGKIWSMCHFKLQSFISFQFSWLNTLSCNCLGENLKVLDCKFKCLLLQTNIIALNRLLLLCFIRL